MDYIAPAKMTKIGAHKGNVTTALNVKPKKGACAAHVQDCNM